MQLRRDVLFSFADVLGEFDPLIVIDIRFIISSLCSLYRRPGWFLLGLQCSKLHWDHLLFYSAIGASHFLQLSKRRRGREREILKTNKTNLICVQHWINNKINSRKLSKSQPTPTHTHTDSLRKCVCVCVLVRTHLAFQWTDVVVNIPDRLTDRRTVSSTN